MGLFSLMLSKRQRHLYPCGFVLYNRKKRRALCFPWEWDPPAQCRSLGWGVSSAGAPLPTWQCSALWDPHEVSLQHSEELCPPHLARAGEAIKDQMWLSLVGCGGSWVCIQSGLGAFGLASHSDGVDLDGCCGHLWVQCYIHLLSAPPCWLDKAS